MPWASLAVSFSTFYAFSLPLLTSFLTFLTCWLLWRKRGSARGAISSTESYETRLQRCESALKTVRLEWEEFYGKAERIIGRANKLAALYGGSNGRETEVATGHPPSNPPAAYAPAAPTQGIDRHALLAAANRGGAASYLAGQRKVTDAQSA